MSRSGILSSDDFLYTAPVCGFRRHLHKCKPVAASFVRWIWTHKTHCWQPSAEGCLQAIKCLFYQPCNAPHHSHTPQLRSMLMSNDVVQHLERWSSFLAAAMATAIGDGICFANVAFFQAIPSTSLNGSLRNFNTWWRRVSVGNRTLRRDFLGYRPQKLGKKLPILDDFVS